MAAFLISGSIAWGKVGGGDITFSVKGATNVLYMHDSHVTKAGLKCSDCHYKIYTTVQGHRKASMADMQQGRSCGACHNGSRAFDVKADCEKCHK